MNDYMPGCLYVRCRKPRASVDTPFCLACWETLPLELRCAIEVDRERGKTLTNTANLLSKAVLFLRNAERQPAPMEEPAPPPRPDPMDQYLFDPAKAAKISRTDTL